MASPGRHGSGETALDDPLAEWHGRQRNATIDVGNDATRLTEPGLLFDGLGFKPFGSGDAPAIISSVADDSAAANAGLEVGDRITRIDGESVTRFGDLQAIVSARANQRVDIEYERSNRTYSAQTTIGEVETDAGPRGQLGVTAATGLSDYVYLRKFGPLASISAAAERTWSSTIFTLRMLGRMITGDVSIKNISGPINIAQFAGDSAERGLNEFLAFLALVSISLGVLNLLPVPVLDGGQIVYQTVELLKGSPMSERSQIIGQQVGILALILLMSFAFYNDIARILG